MIGLTSGPVRVMGVDTALRKSGVAVLEERGSVTRVIESDVIRCPAAWPVSRCLRRLSEEIAGRLERCRPSAVAIEGIFYCRNAKTAMRLGEARGVVISCAARADVPVYEYEPRRVKKAVVGRGGADKTQIARMVAARLDLENPPPEDASDAMAIALCHLQRYGGGAIGGQHAI